MRRRPLRALLALAVAIVLALAGSALLTPAPAQASVCDEIPSVPMLPNPAKTGCKTITKVPELATNPTKGVTDIATAPFKAAGDEVMRGVTRWVANGAAWLVGQAGKLIDETTTPRLASPWFSGQYASMAGLAAVFALPLLLLAVLQGVLRRDPGIVARAAFVHLPAAFVLTGGAVAVVSMLLTLTDEMSAQVAGSAGSDAKAFFADVAKSLNTLSAATGNGAVPLFAVFLGGLIAAVGAFFVWVELLIRSAAIYVTVLFLPFTFVAMIWPTTARWCRRLVELLGAIIASKFVIVAIMTLAAAGLGHSRSADAFQGVLAGTALMLLAALSPLALLRLIPLAEAAAQSHGRSGAGSQAMGPIAGPAATMRRVVDSNWGGSGGGLRAAPTGGASFAPAAATAATAGAAGPRGVSTGGGGRAQSANGSARRGSGSSPATGDQARYAATGGGGQAARPTTGTDTSSQSSGAPRGTGSTKADSPPGGSSPSGKSRPPVETARDPARDRRDGGSDGG